MRPSTPNLSSPSALDGIEVSILLRKHSNNSFTQVIGTRRVAFVAARHGKAVTWLILLAVICLSYHDHSGRYHNVEASPDALFTEDTSRLPPPVVVSLSCGM